MKMNILDRPDVTHEKLQQVVENAFNGLKTFNLIKTSLEMGVFDNLNQPVTYHELSQVLDIEPYSPIISWRPWKRWG
nr:hypothetical protein [Methanobacterium formicicum]